MEKFTATLLSEMNTELKEIAVTAENKVQRAERSFHSVEKAIGKLKEYITNYTFKNIEEEIRFFKEIKPEFQKELIYNEEILFIESNCPMGSAKAHKVYVERILCRIQSYFEKHSYIYNYCRSGENSFDALYFIRSPKPIPMLPVSSLDIDPVFSNPHSYNVAKLWAFEALREYVKRSEVLGTDFKEGLNDDLTKPKSTRVFTGPKAALEEIIQAINSKGWINFGNYGVQKLSRDFEEFLNIKLADPSRALISMAIRKNGYTPHIDNMREALVNRIKEKHQ